LIEGWEKLCWLDTVFKKEVLKSGSFEYYYNLDDSYFKEGFSSIDKHNFLNLSDEELANIIGKIEGLKSDLQKDYSPKRGCGDKDGDIENIFEVKPIKKRKFDSLVKNLTASITKKSEKTMDSWCKISRRFCDFTQDIPGTANATTRVSSRKYRCLFYIDNSGSCSNWGQRFCQVAASLDQSLFEVHLFSFDTRVYEIKKIGDKFAIFGGGGTSFSAVKNHAESFPEKVDIIIVLTDGYSCMIDPKNKKIWNWLLCEGGSAAELGNFNNIHKLSQYE
jgi:hypothetical protein